MIVFGYLIQKPPGTRLDVRVADAGVSGTLMATNSRLELRNVRKALRPGTPAVSDLSLTPGRR